MISYRSPGSWIRRAREGVWKAAIGVAPAVMAEDELVEIDGQVCVETRRWAPCIQVL
jgi:hypothetical protein